ncbi:hypothetical protein ACOME3_000736 [Neoechinorhynchus agilis]
MIVLSTMQRIMDNYHTSSDGDSIERRQRKLDKLNNVKYKTYELLDTSKFDEYTTTTTKRPTTTTTTTEKPYTAAEYGHEEAVNVIQLHEPGITLPEIKVGKRSWEQLNEFRKNPVLSALYEQRPNRLMRMLEKIKSRRDHEDDQLIDPLLVSKLILEKKLKVPNRNASSISGLLHDLENRPLFQRVFIEAPDLLKYITMAIAIKFPKHKFDFVNATLSCDFPQKLRRPPSPLFNPTPWYLQLKDGLRVSFNDRPYPWRHHLLNRLQCVINKAGKRDFMSNRRQRRNQNEICYEYDKMLEYQKDFLNDIIEYPLALEIILRNNEFVNVLLEQAIRLEMQSAIQKRRKPIHEAVLIYLIRNSKVLDAVLREPRLVFSELNKANEIDAIRTPDHQSKVKTAAAAGIDQYQSSDPDKDESFVKKIYINDRPNVDIRIIK